MPDDQHHTAARDAREEVLDNLAWAALRGPQAPLAIVSPDQAAVRYQADVSPFCAVDEATDKALASLAALFDPGEIGVLVRAARLQPAGWTMLMDEPITQYVADDLDPADRYLSDAVTVETLGDADVAAALALVAETEPGPFLPRTMAMGSYWGIRRDGDLIAMAGERMQLPGWSEVSAVCVAPQARGEGLAAGLTLLAAQRIRARGAEAMLHVRAGNVAAHRLYQKIGFRRRAECWIGMMQRQAPA